MSIEEAINAAKLEALNKWDEGHKRCDFGSAERGQGMRDGFGDGVEVGFRAALRSLYVEVKPEDVEDGELCDVKTDDGFQSAFALIHGAEISFWYHEMEEGEVREIFISPLEIKAVYRLSLPSPVEAVGEGV